MTISLEKSSLAFQQVKTVSEKVEDKDAIIKFFLFHLSKQYTIDFKQLSRYNTH